jgi:uncharacterized Zn-binding protein involved in type VI secretion
MKKYFIKIIAVLLLAVVFPLATNFCFQGLLDSISGVHTAQAATVNNQVSAMDMDHCGAEVIPSLVNIQASNMPAANHGNSLLPCCSTGNHPEVITSSSSVQIEKIIPVIFYSDVQVLKIISKNTVYTQPIISPPKLLAVSTTILRL